MTKGETISYAIFKEVSRYNFMEWLKEWNISPNDFNTFINAGVRAINEREQNE
jgi:hypothetical protein